MANIYDDLPTEIWLLIASNLSKHDLFKLKSLNNFFFDRWMESRWENVVIELASRDTDLLLERLANPFVVAKIKTLHVDLDPGRHWTNKTLWTPRALLFRFVSLLSNVTELHISQSTNIFLDSAVFIQTILSSRLTKTVLTLSLTGNVASFVEYSAHNTRFSNLTDFRLMLYDDGSETPQANSSHLLAQFLISIAPTLQRLLIHDRTSLGLSPLFNALTGFPSLSTSNTPVLFPKLQSLVLDLHLTASLRSSPQSLHRVLLTHTNLLLLDLKLMQDETRFNDTDIERTLGGWLGELANNDPLLSSLRILTIYPSVTTTSLSALWTLLKRNAQTLSYLNIWGMALAYSEVEHFVDALTEGKAESEEATAKGRKEAARDSLSIMIGIKQLSLPFLDLMARKLPHLESLVLRIAGSDQGLLSDLNKRRHKDNIGTCTPDPLRTWRLSNLWILDWTTWKQENELERRVADVVPSVEI